MNKGTRRERLIHEILTHCDEIKANKITMMTVLAFQTDIALTKLHKDFLKLT